MAGIENGVEFAGGFKLQTSSARDIADMQRLPTDVSNVNYAGDPEGVVSANPSSFCHDVTSGKIYRKATGTGNTGWVESASIENLTPIGAMQYFATNNGDTTYPNPDWLLCDGSIVNQADYPVLFDRVGLLNPGGQVWSLQDINSTGTIYSLIYGDKFVAGLSSTLLFTSTDAITWTQRSTNLTGRINALCYSGSLYVAAAGNSTTLVATSTDAITWTDRTSNCTGTIAISVAFGGGMYVLNTASGDIASSTDAISWTYRNGTGSLPRTSFVYADGRFINYESTSTDGVSFFTRVPVMSSGSLMKFLNGIYIAAGGAGRLFTSTNSSDWKLQVSGATSTIAGMVYTTQYVYAGSLNVATSTDAVTWTQRTAGTSTNITGLAFGNSKYVYSSGNVAGSSTDGITWSTNATSTTTRGITFGNGIFVVCSQSSNAASSTDGVTWTLRSTGATGIPGCINFSNSLFLMGSINGRVISSTDAITWTINTTPFTTSTIVSVTYGSSVYVATTGVSTCYSSDLITWTDVTSQFNLGNSISEIAHDGSKFIVASTKGVFTSTDGATWTAYSDERGNYYFSNIQQFAYLNNKYIYLADRNVVTSTDAVTWSLSNSFVALSNTISTPICIAYSNGIYVISGFQNTQMNGSGISTANYYIATSTDAITWYRYGQSATSSTMNTGTAALGKFVFGGASGALQTSPDDYIYNIATEFQLPTQANSDGQLVLDFDSNLSKNLYIRALQ